jgi:uncharacterized membrane protein (DUF2068 family)
MKRPGIITFICILGYLSILFAFPQVFSPSIKRLGMFMPAIYGILVALTFISFVGLWYFKQWGVTLFTVSFFGKLIFFIVTDQTGPGFFVSLVINIFFLIVFLRHYPRMNQNL